MVHLRLSSVSLLFAAMFLPLLTTGCPRREPPPDEDNTMPMLAITSPGMATTEQSPTIGVSFSDEAGGSGIDEGSLQVSVDDTDISGDCTIQGGTALCDSPTLLAGAHMVSASIADRAGNSQQMMLNFSIVLSLQVGITSPPNNLLTNMDSVTVSGAITGNATSVAVNNIAAPLTGGAYSLEFPLREGINDITVIAQGPSGETGSASARVTRDTHAPSAVIESPSNNQLLSASAVTVTGQVYDVTAGPVTNVNCMVRVSGRTGSFTAEIDNGTFVVEDFPIVAGNNMITATPIDAVGNEGPPFSIQVRNQALVGQQLQIVSGDKQMGVAGKVLDQPVIIQALDANSQPLMNRLVDVKVVRNNGSIGDGAKQLSLRTDAQGLVSFDWSLGDRAGLGNNRLEITSPGFPAPLTVCASAAADDCAMLVVEAGQSQIGIAGQPLAEPFVVIALDEMGNRCPDQTLSFTIESGAGVFDGASSVDVQTNESGIAAAVLTLGPMPGVNNNVVRVTPAGGGAGVVLLASGEAPDIAAPTRFVGLVLDTNNDPIANALVSILETDPPVETTTNQSGAFTLDNVPLGSQLLFVDGSVAFQGSNFPFIELFVDILPGVDNTLGRPIFLPETDQDNFQIVGGDQDVTLLMDGLDGFGITVFANSATFPDGAVTGLMGVSQVSNDQVPMPPNAGAAPPWVGTFQPPLVHFDPPARLTAPNTQGLPAGQIVDMYSFDHHLGMYVSIGTGSVQPGGATIVSDPGNGIRVSGWHFAAPPPPPPVEIKNDMDVLSNKDIQNEFKDALDDSDQGNLPVGPMGEHEEGGWIIQDAEGNIRAQRAPPGDGDSLTNVAPVLNDGDAVLAHYHTHPENPAYQTEPSGTDLTNTPNFPATFGFDGSEYLGGYVISCNEIWVVDNMGNSRKVSNTGPNPGD